MKSFLLITIFFTTSLLANYTYVGENSGKIDMHGGKSDKLINNGFKDTKFNSLKSLGTIEPVKPKTPVTPKSPNDLIKIEKTPTK